MAQYCLSRRLHPIPRAAARYRFNSSAANLSTREALAASTILAFLPLASDEFALAAADTCAVSCWICASAQGSIVNPHVRHAAGEVICLAESDAQRLIVRNVVYCRIE